MYEQKNDKAKRILNIYSKLMNGETINKTEEALQYNVNERSIQRDIDEIRNFLEMGNVDSKIINTVIYDRIQKVYRLEQKSYIQFSNSEILALCKILLDSRAFTKAEMTEMINKLIDCCLPENNKKMVADLIRNEAYHYIEPRHKTKFVNTMWDIGQAIHNCKYIEIDYLRTKDKSVVKRKLRPVAIMFSEYYFYLAAFINDKELQKNFDVINDSFPTIYRMDRIRSLKVLDEKFYTPYKDKFEEGEFKKRIQFMYGGKLQKIKFRYFGSDIDSVLDRLPTAKILSEENGIFTVSAEVFGKGIDMWIRSQGNLIELL